MIIVEFVGLPGSGKTTITKEICSLLKNESYSVYTRGVFNSYWDTIDKIERRKRYIHFIVNNIRLSIELVIYLMLLKPIRIETFDFGYQFYRIVYKMYEAIKNAKREGFDFIVYDQGLLQALWSIHVSGTPRREESLKKWIKRICDMTFKDENYFIIFLKDNHDVVIERIKKRHTMESRFDLMDQNTAGLKLKLTEKNLALIVETALKSKSVDGTYFTTSKCKTIEKLPEIVKEMIPKKQEC